MQTTLERHPEAMRDVVSSYVRALDVPALDECAVAARRGMRSDARPFRVTLRTIAVAVAAAAAFAVFVAVDAPVVVAGVQRVFAAFTLNGGRAVPMSIRAVDLATARADMTFAIIAPPVLPYTTMTLREIRSTGSPASNSVVFELTSRRLTAPVSIVESRDGNGPRQLYLSTREPGGGDANVAAPDTLPRPSDRSGTRIAIVGKLGGASFVPLTWVTRGTRIVLMSGRGGLSAADVHTIRSAMSK